MLPSPIIEGTLPAFYVNETGIAVITVPFSMSRAVNRNEVSGFSLKIKSLQGSEYLGTFKTKTGMDYTEMVVKFELTRSSTDKYGNDILQGLGDSITLTKGAFYKAQIAYINNQDEVGYYSTVGIIKYTTKPNVSIANLSTSQNNTHTYTYTGVYSQEGMDTTEKIYSYRFVIKNNKNEVVEDTDYLIHNSANDVEYYESHDDFLYTYDLVPNDKYTITYSVKTNNGLEVSGPAYKIIQKETLPLSVISNITPILNYDNGYIEVFFNKDVINETSVNGTFVLSRASEDYQYQNWETIVEFNLFAQKPSDLTWKDFSIEQGKQYKYSIQQYSKVNQLYSQRLISNVILADFEDAFLYDGKQQLKIRFNPKVNSFKKNLFEAKVDTLGSKYPFIFRNGNVEYKEFPISGLISYLSDEQSLFGNNAIQFEAVEREGVYIYSPFSWQTHTNSIIQDTLRREQYKTNYLFFYIWDSAQSQYVKWVDYLIDQYKDVYFKEPWIDSEGILHPGIKLVNTKYFDPSDYDAYFDASKTYYLRTTKETNRFNPDELKLKTTNLVSYNVSLERDFKMNVLNWLTNGEPKLFRSPSEGNFIVRLMNVSLTPEEKTGRMLHTFNSTAYEIADFNYSNLKAFNFINTSNFKSKYLKIHSIPLIVKRDADAYDEGKPASPVNYVTDGNYWYAVGELIPTGSSTEFLEINDAPNIIFNIDQEQISIGYKGYYDTTVPISSIMLSNNWYQEREDLLNEIPHVTMGYFTDIDDSFSIISNVELKEICGRQFIGYYEEIKPLLETPLLDSFETQFLSYQTITLYKRGIVEADGFTDDGEIALYNDEGILVPFSKNSQKIDLFRYIKSTDDEWGDLYQQLFISDYEDYEDLKMWLENKMLYQLKNGEFISVDNVDEIGTYYLKKDIIYIYDALEPDKKYLDDESQRLFEKQWKVLGKGEFLDYTIPYTYSYNYSEPISLKQTLWERLESSKMDPLESLTISAGLICDITYRVQITKYDIINNAYLTDLRFQLDTMLKTLSQEGMLEATNAGLANADQAMKKYIEELNKIYYSQTVGEGYQVTYNEYIKKLAAHIEKTQQYS